MIPLDSKTRLLNACRGEPVDQTPVWYMRQAGRIFSEYRALREDHSFMEICHSPALTSRVTRMPVEQLGVDAAIIFADIMHPLQSLGRPFELVKGKGPVIDDPIRAPSDVDDLRVGNPRQDVDFLFDGLRETRSDLDDSVGLIGFAGAPFTLACYLIEGESSRTFNRAKQFMVSQPDAFDRLMNTITKTLIKYLTMQIEAGADVVQLFDSWVGILSPHHYRGRIQDHVARIFKGLPDSTPSIYFGTGTPSLLKDMAETGPDVLGVDWRIELRDAHERIDRSIPLQGNLDPSLMLAPFESIESPLGTLLEQAESLPGHIFNLGHGFHPDTPLDTIRRVTQFVREKTGAVSTSQ